MRWQQQSADRIASVSASLCLSSHQANPSRRKSLVQPQTSMCRCPAQTYFLLSLPFGSLVQSLLHGILSQQQPWPVNFSRQIYPCQHLSLKYQLLPHLKGCVEALKTKTREGTVPRPPTKKSDFFLLHFNQSQSYCLW